VAAVTNRYGAAAVGKPRWIISSGFDRHATNSPVAVRPQKTAAILSPRSEYVVLHSTFTH